MRFFLFLFLFTTVFTDASYAARVKVVDGDSLEIDGVRIRLEGIDSPEYGQSCFSGTGEKYYCGDESYYYLKNLVKDRHLICVESGRDKYNRSLCECFVDDENDKRINVNEQMVKSGWAVAYRNKNKLYKNAEKYAKKHRIGMWQGKFMKPELQRILYGR